MTTPHKKLVKILQPAYDPCRGFDGTCKTIATWRPACGYAPRGFIGAMGRLKEVKVVVLLSEPGCPHPTESYEDVNTLEQTCRYTLEALSDGTDRFHKRLKALLDLLFPNLPLKGQLRKSMGDSDLPVLGPYGIGSGAHNC